MLAENCVLTLSENEYFNEIGHVTTKFSQDCFPEILPPNGVRY